MKIYMLICFHIILSLQTDKTNQKFFEYAFSSTADAEPPNILRNIMCGGSLKDKSQFIFEKADAPISHKK